MNAVINVCPVGLAKVKKNEQVLKSIEKKIIIYNGRIKQMNKICRPT